MNSKKYENSLYKVEYVETIREFIRATVNRYPDRWAYMYKDVHGEPWKHITYQDFYRKMNGLGTSLLNMGLKGENMAVVGESSYRWVLSYFTIASGAGVVVPIDKNLEEGEMVNLLTRADVKLLFASAKMADKIGSFLDQLPELKYLVIMDSPVDDVDKYLQEKEGPDGARLNAFGSKAEILLQSGLIEKGRERLAAGDRIYMEQEVDQEDLSTILFTSGTTGLAKGAMLSHRNLTQNVVNMSKYFHIPEGGRVLSVLPIHHAYECTCTIMTCFYQGATVVICEGLKHIQTNFVDAGCCIMLGVPLIFENIYRKIWHQAEKSGSSEQLRRAIALSKRLNLQNRPSVTKRMFKPVHQIFGDKLYCLIAGGAAIDPKVVIEFQAMGLPIIQGYGMTENAPIIAMNTDRYSKANAAGKVMPGTEVRVIDQDETGIGEIICKGPSVMMGYYKDPENTEKTIVNGWLQTGDYGYMDEDGFVYITGRKKNVIVTKGGKNIFPEEVEYYLLLNPYINEVLVYGKPEESKGDLLCTAIIYPEMAALKEIGATSDKEIASILSAAVEEANAKMPPYKRVRRFEVRDKEFVKTTTLKIKRFEEANYEYKYDDRTFR